MRLWIVCAGLAFVLVGCNDGGSTQSQGTDGSGVTGGTAVGTGENNGTTGVSSGNTGGNSITGGNTGTPVGTSGNGTPTPTSTPSGSSTSTTNSTDWNLTVYYTAVESFHSGSPTQVSGCLNLECSSSGVIGSYPSDFVDAVKAEGAGRITSGNHAGAYLNWSSDVGYWLDTAPRDAQGGVLQPWATAAADASVFAFGVAFKVVDCGTDDSGGGIIDSGVCNQLKQANWKINDRFTPGMGGTHHLDLYIGEEDQVNFTSTSPKEISVKQAILAL